MTSIACIIFAALIGVSYGFFNPLNPSPASNAACKQLCTVSNDKFKFDLSVYKKFQAYLVSDNSSWNQISAAINSPLTWEMMTYLYEDNQNVVYYPLGAANLLAMIFLGANGKTKLEFQNLLNIYSGNWDSSAIQKAIAMYENAAINGKYGFYCAHLEYIADKYKTTTNVAYQKYITEVFKAKLAMVNFGNDQESIKKSINDYINMKTKQKYQNALKTYLAAANSISLLNAVYFKGRWEEAFDSKLTFDGNFKDSQNIDKAVKMMSRVGAYFYNRLDSRKLEILELPYYNNISIFLILPFRNSSLNKDVFISGKTYLESGMKTAYQVEANLKIPKLRLEYESNLKSPFEKMGIRGAFNEEILGISKGASVSETKQMVYFEVDEGNIAENLKKPPPPSGLPKVEFFVDRPFAFLIKDKKRDCNLFAGAVNKITIQ